MSDIAPQDIIVIVDESGSMSMIGSEAVQSLNSFIKDQKTAQGDDGATFSLWKFNTTVTRMIDDQPLQEVNEFEDYVPTGMTALLDAIGNAIITKKGKKKSDNVICLIITDGMDNSSHDFSVSTVRKLTKEMEKEHNWKFVYLGANQDAFDVGNTFGIDKSRCANFSCTEEDIFQATRQTSMAIARYRSDSATCLNRDLLLTPEDHIPSKPAMTRLAGQRLSSPIGLDNFYR